MRCRSGPRGERIDHDGHWRIRHTASDPAKPQYGSGQLAAVVAAAEQVAHAATVTCTCHR